MCHLEQPLEEIEKTAISIFFSQQKKQQNNKKYPLELLFT